MRSEVRGLEINLPCLRKFRNLSTYFYVQRLSKWCGLLLHRCIMLWSSNYPKSISILRFAMSWRNSNFCIVCSDLETQAIFSLALSVRSIQQYIHFIKFPWSADTLPVQVKLIYMTIYSTICFLGAAIPASTVLAGPENLSGRRAKGYGLMERYFWYDRGQTCSDQLGIKLSLWTTTSWLRDNLSWGWDYGSYQWVRLQRHR